MVKEKFNIPSLSSLRKVQFVILSKEVANWLTIRHTSTPLSVTIPLIRTFRSRLNLSTYVALSFWRHVVSGDGKTRRAGGFSKAADSCAEPVYRCAARH